MADHLGDNCNKEPSAKCPTNHSVPDSTMQTRFDSSENGAVTEEVCRKEVLEEPIKVVEETVSDLYMSKPTLKELRESSDCVSANNDKKIDDSSMKQNKNIDQPVKKEIKNVAQTVKMENRDVGKALKENKNVVPPVKENPNVAQTVTKENLDVAKSVKKEIW